MSASKAAGAAKSKAQTAATAKRKHPDAAANRGGPAGTSGAEEEDLSGIIYIGCVSGSACLLAANKHDLNEPRNRARLTTKFLPECMHRAPRHAAVGRQRSACMIVADDANPLRMGL